MLLQFRFSNFRSFRTEQTLSMIASSLRDRPEAVIHAAGLDEGALPVAAVYGANASGKSNMILALQLMSRIVRNSHARWEPNSSIEREHFAGESALPTTFEVAVLLSGVRYQYGFSIDSDVILEEWLNAYPMNKKQKWFARQKGRTIAFSAKLQGDNRTIERLTRPNSLFLSAAAQNNHVALARIHSWLVHSLLFAIGERATIHPYAAALCVQPNFRETLAQFLSSADLGISEVGVEERVIPDEVTELLRTLVTAVKLNLDDVPESRDLAKTLRFLHSIGKTTVPFGEAQESKGTIAFLNLLVPILRAIKDGKVVCVDELDESLHPLLAIEIIRLFSNPARNPKSAQLIFNTHDTNLLSMGILRRDQIWFTEKGRDGASQLYPLTDFKPRREENLEIGYLQGRYGAIPFLNPDRFLASCDDANEKAR